MADETLNVNDGTLNVRAGSLGGTSMRYHELAVQWWLNSIFYVREGYAVPVVFTSPLDAFSHFQQLWSEETNPFTYLFDLKDAQGTPLYAPHPSPVRYPIISVHRKSWKLRQYQNFSIHRWRHINWPTVANAGAERYGPNAQGWNLTKCSLGNVTTSRMPMAWDYRFQVDHFCNRPDTQAFYVEQLMQQFWRTGGTVPQTWITVPYPGYGNRRVRLYLDGDIENMTPEEPEEGRNVEFRTSFTMVVEGFDLDLRYEIYPALWNLVLRFGSVAPIELNDAFNMTRTIDLRATGSNPTLDIRPNVPTWGTCQESIQAAEEAASEQTAIQVLTLNESGSNSFGLLTISAFSPDIFVDSCSGSIGFLSGSVYDAAFLTTTVYGTDCGRNSTAFVYGSADIYPYQQNSTFVVGLTSGSVHDVTMPSGTSYSSGSFSVLLHSGTLADVTIWVYGTEFGTISSSFYTGTLFDTTVSAGSTSTGTNSVVLLDGTLATLVLGIGTFFGPTSTTIGLLNGTLA